MPKLFLCVVAYLMVVPLLSLQAGAMALVALTAAFIFLPAAPGAPDVGYGFAWPLVPFFLVLLVAVARSPAPQVTTGFLSFHLPGLVLFLIAMRNPRWDPRLWMVAWSLFSVVMSASVLVAWLRIYFGAELPLLLEVPEGALLLSGNTLLNVPNDICVTAVLLCFPLGLLAPRHVWLPSGGNLAGIPPWSLRALAIVTIFLAVLAMTILRSRTGFVVAVLEVLVVSAMWRRFILYLLPLAAVLVVADHVFGVQTLEKLFLSNNMDNHGVSGRLGLWASAWSMFAAAPWFGHGAQSFGPGHGVYMPDWAPRFPERRVMWAHSLYLETLAEQGVVGLAAFCILVLPALRGLVITLIDSKNVVILRTVAVVGLAGLAGFLIAAGLELSFIRRWVPLVMFGLLGFAYRYGVRAPGASAIPDDQTGNQQPAGLR